MTVRVSDHALLRWLERHHGLDVEGERRKIAAVAKAANGVDMAIQHDGVKIVIVGDTVTTVLRKGIKRARLGGANA